MRLIILMLAGTMLVGCASSEGMQNRVDATTNSDVGVSSGSLGQYLAQNQSTVADLESQGIQIVHRGDNLMLTLPSDSLFVQGSTVLDKKYRPVLKRVAYLLSGLEKTGIKVAGYTDSTQSPLRNAALSRQQAETVADYLWRQGIDVRLLSAVGYGEQLPIANNNTRTGQTLNRRVEISLQLATEPDDL